MGRRKRKITDLMDSKRSLLASTCEEDAPNPSEEATSFGKYASAMKG
jgi:hypothetical protein